MLLSHVLENHPALVGCQRVPGGFGDGFGMVWDGSWKFRDGFGMISGGSGMVLGWFRDDREETR